MTALQAAVVNQSLELIAAQTTITDLNDGTVLGNAAGVIYTPLVQMLLRQLDPDFARKTAALVSATGTPLLPYSYEYTYPAECLRTRQVRPPGSGPGALADPFDPLPVRWAVAFDSSSKVILTNQQNAFLVYTTNIVTETFWDPLFLQVVVDRLAVPLSMAAVGRPDFARALLEEATAIAAMSEGRDDGI